VSGLSRQQAVTRYIPQVGFTYLNHFVVPWALEVQDNGWTPILDPGVRVNIEPLKEAKLLPVAAERVK
jgi:hypothetical protein